MRKYSIRPGLLAALPALVVVACFLADQLRTHGGLFLASDDSYIYLGYVKRTLEAPRELFSYNRGEHSAGTTGLLYYYALVVLGHVLRLPTLAWPLHVTLRLSSFVLASGLTIVSSLLYWASWRNFDPERRRAPWFTFALAMALFFSNARFLWGLFAGLENPLSATLLLALVHALAIRGQAWRVGVLGGLLIATRPDLAGVLWLVPLFHAGLQPRGVSRWRGAAIAAATLAVTVLVLIAPCYALTGRLFPSALDTRVHVEAVRDPKLIVSGMLDALRLSKFLATDWQIVASTILIGAAVVSFRRRHVHPALFLSGFVVLLFFVRSVFHIEQLNIEDRYVSYVWPLLTLAGGTLAAPALRRGLARSRVTEGVSSVAVAVLAVVFPVRDGFRRLDRDVTEMNEVVVEPSLFMQRQVPPGTHVAMEPAGAIRVFTDFYLVDGFGLTTEHLGRAGTWDAMVEAEKVEYVFDYAARLPQLTDESRFELIRRWMPMHPVYVTVPIGFYRRR